MPAWGHFMGATGGSGASRDLEEPQGSHPGAELLLSVGVAFCPPAVARPWVSAGSRGPRGGRQQRAEAPGQAGAGGGGEHQQWRQREEAQHDERRGAAVGEQREARGDWRWVDLRAGRTVRGGARSWWIGPGLGEHRQRLGWEDLRSSGACG